MTGVAPIDESRVVSARQSQKDIRRSSKSLSSKSQSLAAADEREAKTGTRRGASNSSRGRRDKVAPVGLDSSQRGRMRSDKHEPTAAAATPPPRRNSRKASSRKGLKVDTDADVDYVNNASTPSTVASTPSPQAASNGLRSNGDLRSPGQHKTPVAKVASTSDPVPDLITQTDANGNAVTPRNAKAIESARQIHPSGPKPHLHHDKNGKLTESKEIDDMDACTETLLDSIRIMCCCLLPEEEAAGAKVPMQNGQKDAQAEPARPRLLPSLHPDDKGKKCLVLDLDETLVHSSFRAVPGADFVIPVQIEDVVHFVYVMKRPGVDEFLVEMAKHYEVVIYTASLNKYADPLLDLLDPHKTIRTRLFRESCVYHEGNYVKDLSLLDRDLRDTIIVDNSPSSYIFHPENAIDCTSFIDDPNDRELDQIAAFLAGVKSVKDVRNVCQQWRDWPNVNTDDQ